MTENLHFFLGGHDLEMVEIGKMLTDHKALFSDKSLAWGARVSDYRSEIINALEHGEIPVLIELEIDPLPKSLPLERCQIVDHHGEHAGKDEPTAIEQVAVLLGMKVEALSRWQQLVSANDKGHIQAMKEMGASDDEIKQIRLADRRAQGMTAEQEQDSLEAIQNREEHGELTVIKTDLETSSAIADFMQPELGGAGYKNLLVVLKSQISFFGSGKIVLALAEKFPNGWYGGALPDSGFWGCDIGTQIGDQSRYDNRGDAEFEFIKSQIALG